MRCIGGGIKCTVPAAMFGIYGDNNIVPGIMRAEHRIVPGIKIAEPDIISC
jgi:hypothetical protein